MCIPGAIRRILPWPTRLARIAEVRQERPTNWGYAVCDVAMRAYVETSLADPKELPYPARGGGRRR